MSVFPQFLQHIQDQGLYIPGYNYEEMYNIMVDALITDTISTNNFIYTNNQVNDLYELLYELLYPMPDLIETETNEPILINDMNYQQNQNIQNIEHYENIYDADTDADTDDDINTNNTHNDTINIQINNVQMLLNHYINNIQTYTNMNIINPNEPYMT